VADEVRELAWTIDEHGRRRLTPKGLYVRRKMTPQVHRSLPDATPGAVDRAMRSLCLSGVRRAKSACQGDPDEPGTSSASLQSGRERADRAPVSDAAPGGPADTPERATRTGR